MSHFPVIPAKAGIQLPWRRQNKKLDSRFRGNDGWLATIAGLLLLLCAFPAFAQTLPKLTGRVVDTAGLLQPEQAAALDAKLAAIEQSTGHQLFVATVPDLQGYPIEDFGIRLLRTWAPGTKEKDDGAILLVAKNDRKLRIEVGYGLEPLLTDAYSSVVINTVITPKFKAGDYAGGIDSGVDSIAEQIKLTPEEAAKRTAELAGQERKSATQSRGSNFLPWIFVLLFVIFPLFGRLTGGGRHHRTGLGNALLWTAINVAANSGRNNDSGGWGGGGGDWGGGGGFGGGGGGSGGGGGASGGW